jgi:MoxR-like ATPase
MFKLMVEFPSLEQLDTIMTRTIAGEAAHVERIASREQLFALREAARQVGIAPSLQKYALRILQATHPQLDGAPAVVKRYVREGASPRAGQAMLQAARVHALMRGEPMISELDIRVCALPALRHRVILNFEGEAEGVHRDRLIEEVISAVPRA